MGIGARIRGTIEALSRAAEKLRAAGERRALRDDAATLLRLYAVIHARHSSAPAFLILLYADGDTSTIDAEQLDVLALDSMLDRARREAAARSLECACLVATRVRAAVEVDGVPGARAEVVLTRTDDGTCRESFLLHLDPADARFGTMTEVEVAADGVLDQRGFAVPIPAGVLGHELTVDEDARGAVVDFAAWRAERAAEDTRHG